MRKFGELYIDFKFVQTLSAQITWSHNIEIMNNSRLKKGNPKGIKDGTADAEIVKKSWVEK